MFGLHKDYEADGRQEGWGRLEAPVDWHQPFPNLHLCPICLAASQDIAPPPPPPAWEVSLEGRMLSQDSSLPV